MFCAIGSLNLGRVTPIRLRGGLWRTHLFLVIFEVARNLRARDSLYWPLPRFSYFLPVRSWRRTHRA